MHSRYINVDVTKKKASNDHKHEGAISPARPHTGTILVAGNMRSWMVIEST
jgi:hypothetical protein